MRRPLAQLPNHHREIHGHFLGVTEDGTTFDLEVRKSRKRANSGEVVRNHIRAATRGMPMTERDLYVDSLEIGLLVGRYPRQEVRVNANGTYSVGNRPPRRSLREVVGDAVAATKPRPPVPAPTA